MVELTRLEANYAGARIKFQGDKRIVTDGPFPETKELVGGFWIIEVKSKQEAIEWGKRVPNPYGPEQESEIEIRQIVQDDSIGGKATDGTEAGTEFLER